MVTDAIKLEREKRKTAKAARSDARIDNLLEILGRPEVITPLMLVGGSAALQKLGESRIINRDYAGFLLSLWVAVCLAEAGVTDKWALGAATALAATSYALATPSTGEEAFLTIEPGKLLGGDGKLFWWDMSGIPIVGQWLGQQ
jgi:hypothetical protein